MNNPIEMYFKDIEDPRKGWNVQYPLEEVMLVAMVSFLVGGEGFEDMKEMGDVWVGEFRKYYPFERGTPSADTFRNVFMVSVRNGTHLTWRVYKNRDGF